MPDIYKSMTRTICQIGVFKLKMLIMLDNDKEILLDDYTVERSNAETDHYLSLNYFPMVVIDNIKKGMRSYKRKSSIIMTQRNQHVIISAFEKMRKILYNNDLFYSKDGHIFTYHIDKEYIVHEYGAGNNNYIVLYPTVVVDNDEREYEGVRMFFNTTEIFGDLSIDEFEALLGVMKRIDIFTYSQSLLNFYFTYKDKVVLPDKQPKKKKNLFVVEKHPLEEESVQSNIVKKDADENLMDGLKGIEEI